jgi:histidine ammonia-lyase
MKPLETTPELQRVHAAVRELVPYQAHDRRLDLDIATLASLVHSGRLSTYLAAHD